MITFSNITAGLALGLVMTSATVPAFAAGTRTHHGDRAAPAVEQSIGSREDALRLCNHLAEDLYDYKGGNRKTYTYRACMADHGQPE